LRSSFVIATYGYSTPHSWRISRALHLDVFDQPGENYFFNNRIEDACGKNRKLQDSHPLSAILLSGNFYFMLKARKRKSNI